MGIKVGHVSIGTIVEKYTSEKLKDLEANPPQDIIREQESIETLKKNFTKACTEIMGEDEEFNNQTGWYYFEIARLFKESFPVFTDFVNSVGRQDPDAITSALDQCHYGGWYYGEKIYYVESDEQYKLQYEQNRWETLQTLIDTTKAFKGKIDTDKADIKNLNERYKTQIQTEADKKVRDAMQALATAGSYDLIYDPSEVAMVALNPEDVSDKVSAKVV